MGEGAGEFEMLALGQTVGETIDVGGGDTEAIHAGVDLEVDRSVSFASFGGGRGVK
jgi:hypothetical protein